MAINKVDRLAELVGSYRKIAEIIGRDAGIVTRMRRKGVIRPEFNPAIRAWLADFAPGGGTFAKSVLACLERDICPHCGQPMPAGRVV